MIKPLEVAIKDQEDTEHRFIISKVPAIPMREIIAGYPLTSLPKLGDYKANEEIMLKLISYVEIVKDGVNIKLSTRALIDNHCTDWEVLAKLEKEMLQYNCSFLKAGILSGLINSIKDKIPNIAQSILKQYLQQSSKKSK